MKTVDWSEPNKPETKKLSWEDIKKEEGIYSVDVAHKDVRVIVVRNDAGDVATLWFNGNELQPTGGDWSRFTFRRTDERLFMRLR